MKGYDLDYFKEHDHLDLLLAESLLLLVKSRGYKSILDVGCGSGQLVRFFNKKGLKAIGIDPIDEAVKMARKINQPRTILKAPAGKLPFKDNSFDLITGISMVEHLKPLEAKQFLKESMRILKPNGTIFLITPNFNSPLRLLLKEKWFGYSDPTHISFFTPQSLSNLLRKQGFSNIKFRFKSARNIKFDWQLPSIVRPLPQPAKDFINYLMISSYLSTFRDSFWISGEKQ